MKPQEFSELQNLCKIMAQLKKQIVNELPHYGNESLFFYDDSITTGLMNNRAEIKLHMLEQKLLFFDNEKAQFVDINENNITDNISDLAKSQQLKMPDIKLQPIPETSLVQFYDFAFLAQQILELFRMKLDGSFTLVHLWPHHFDFSIEWFTGKDDQQIGTGISPSDDQYSEPYMYMNPWPFNKQVTNEKLPIGVWQEDGWNGIKVELEEFFDIGPLNAAGEIYELFNICKRNFSLN